MALHTRKRTILAKLESTYDTDPSATGAANAILTVGDPTITPLDLTMIDRQTIAQHMGNGEKLAGDAWVMMEFAVEMAGSGAAGTAPAWGPLVRACGFSETITAGTSVVYAPVDSSFESITIPFNLNGVLHKMTGGRGSVKAVAAAGDTGKFNFRFLGNFQPVTDAALPPVTLTGWKKPLPINDTNSDFALHGYAAKLQSLELDIGNELVKRILVNDAKQARIADRAPTGKVSFEATTVAEKDWWASMRDLTAGTLLFTQGTAAGSIVEISCPSVQIGNPRYADFQKTWMLNADLYINPSAGNDELVFTVK